MTDVDDALVFDAACLPLRLEWSWCRCMRGGDSDPSTCPAVGASESAGGSRRSPRRRFCGADGTTGGADDDDGGGCFREEWGGGEIPLIPLELARGL